MLPVMAASDTSRTGWAKARDLLIGVEAQQRHPSLHTEVGAPLLRTARGKAAQQAAQATGHSKGGDGGRGYEFWGGEGCVVWEHCVVGGGGHGVSRVLLGEHPCPGHILCAATTTGIVWQGGSPASTRDGVPRGFQRQGNAAWCWKSPVPRPGNSDRGSFAP